MDEGFLQLFGPPTRVGGEARTPLLPQRLHQLAVLLAVSGQWQPRERLAAMFWPELHPAAARRNLRNLLFKGAQQWPSLEVLPGAVRLRMRTDVHAFEAAHAAGDFAQAMQHYRGPFGDGLESGAPPPFDEWLRFERGRLAGLFRAAAAQRLAQIGTAAEREQLALAWLKLEPLDEAPLVALVEAVAESGRLVESRRIAEDFARRLADELGVDPSSRVRTLAATADAPVVPTRSGTAGAAAPPEAPGFVGRRAELLQLHSLLSRDECRVLTVTGPGGIGKSRLTQVAFAHASPGFEAHVWIALEDLADVAQIAPRIASGLNLALGGQADPLTQVIEHLRGRRVLLVADNSEHLNDFPALCSQLLRECPRLKMLHTSRARLGIEGEWLLPLPGLPVPDADECEAAVLASFDAVKLFAARACASAPSFNLDAQAADVAALVRDLEGAPLAIELAAAWVRMLPVAEIRQQIAHSLDLLESNSAAPARHRSARASFDHSWRLLSPIEQASLARMSVFVGPFTLTAFAQVALVPFAVLAALIDKSLLRADGDGRFSFHPLVRHHVRARDANAAVTLRRYIDHHVQLLHHYGELNLTSGKQTIDAIEAQLEDLRTVWVTVVRSANVRAIETMAAPLFRFFEIKGRWSEGIALFSAALGQLDADIPAQRAAVAAASRALAGLHYRKGEPHVAELTARRALKLFRGLKQLAGARYSLQIMGLSLWQRGELERAQRYFEEGLKLAERAGDETGAAAPLNGIAMCEKSRGRYAQARPLYERALALYRRSGGAQGLAITLNNLGNVLRLQRDHEGARRYFAEGLALCVEHGLSSARIFFLINLGCMDIDAGRLDRAQAHFDQALQADSAAGEGQSSAEIRLGLGRIAALRGQLDEAERWLSQCVRSAQALADTPIQLAGVSWFGELAARRGATHRAAQLWAFVAGHPLAEQEDRTDARTRLAALDLHGDAMREVAQAAASLQLERLLPELTRA